jgi:hypothetical protein
LPEMVVRKRGFDSLHPLSVLSGRFHFRKQTRRET